MPLPLSEQFAPADIKAAMARQRLMMMALRGMEQYGYQSPNMPYSLGQDPLQAMNANYEQTVRDSDFALAVSPLAASRYLKR